MKFKLSEMYVSIQGESTFSGLKCVFYRLSGCNLNCIYCDTPNKDTINITLTIDELLKKTLSFIKEGICLFEFTGGEPLLYKQQIKEFLSKLDKKVNKKITFLIETNGSINIDDLNGYKKIDVVTVMDIKSPTSGEWNKNYINKVRKNYESKNLNEVKCVIGKNDFEWLKKELEILDKSVRKKIIVLLSPIFNQIDLVDIANFIVKYNEYKNIELRMQIQLHKIIWGENKKGV